MSKTRKCGRCKGSGLSIPDGRYSWPTKPYPCSRCHGKGVLP